VLERFCKLDADGAQLTPDGSRSLAAYFEKLESPQFERIVVVKDFVVSRPSIHDGQAEFYVEYVELGRIDPAHLRFSSPLPPGIKVRSGFDLVVRNPTSLSASRDRTKEPANWHIVGAIPDPHVNVEAAIRYVAELRAKATTASAQRNADKVLAALRHFR
jgi:hypothetical protein